MANTYLTPNMSLIIPVPNQDPGPDWANNINASLTILDAHTHLSGSGVQITPPAMNINTDLSFQGNNATVLRSVRFSPQLSPLSGINDLGCLYESGVDLYYNDGSGNQIRITQSGNVSGSSGTITGLPSGTASASYAAGTFTFQSATSTAATLDVGTVIIRKLTASSPGISLTAPSGLSANYTFTLLQAPPSSSQVLTMDTSGNMGTVTADGIAAAMTVTGADTIAATMDATGANDIAATMNSIGANDILATFTAIPTAQANTVGQAITSLGADSIGQNMTSTGANAVANARTRATGSSVGVGGVASGSGSGTTTGTLLIASCQITTSGRPVRVFCCGDSGSADGYFATIGASSTIRVYFDRNGTTINRMFAFSSAGSLYTPASAFSTIDFIGAGTYTYDVTIQATSGTVSAQNIAIIAYEL